MDTNRASSRCFELIYLPSRYWKRHITATDVGLPHRSSHCCGAETLSSWSSCTVEDILIMPLQSQSWKRTAGIENWTPTKVSQTLCTTNMIPTQIIMGREYTSGNSRIKAWPCLIATAWKEKIFRVRVHATDINLGTPLRFLCQRRQTLTT